MPITHHRSFPRARSGLKRLAASMPPPSAPRPAMMRCSSSMNRMTPGPPSSAAFSTSLRTAFIRSSYSPWQKRQARVTNSRKEKSCEPLYLAPVDVLVSNTSKEGCNVDLPAISAPMSKEKRREIKLAGTSRFTILWARPSAMLVLPTPGSPIRTGLFFVLRPNQSETKAN